MMTSSRPHPYSLLNSIIPEPRNPYYIVSPKYIRTSAGIKALHMLCHALNRIGERAYIILHPHHPLNLGFNVNLLTPPLTSKVIQEDFERGLTPITIYNETVPGNPFNSPVVIRYICNYPGLLGGDKVFAINEFLLAYSQNIGDVATCGDSILFIPTSDVKIFSPEPRQQRLGTSFYASKYQHVHGGNLFHNLKNSVEITRDLPDSQTPEEIADIFRKSELFYCYENSALIIEALLCECPVVMLPNPYLSSSIAEFELGWDGIAWGCSESEIARAKATVKNSGGKYLHLYDTFWDQLSSFVLKTQSLAASTPYKSSVRLSYSEKRTMLNWISDAARMLDFIVRTEGWPKALSHSVGWVKRHGFTIIK